MQDAMQQFFDAFVSAFASFDGALIAQRYRAPYLALNAEGEARLFATNADIGAYFQGIVDQYFAQGCRACRFSDLQVTALGAAAALATVSWELLDADAQVLGGWQESYNLVHTAGGWRICVSTDHATDKHA